MGSGARPSILERSLPPVNPHLTGVRFAGADGICYGHRILSAKSL